MDMKKIEVEIEGVTPLLMNSPKAMLEESNESVQKTKKRNHKDDAEKVAYRMKNGNLYVPSEAVKGCLINASSYKKAGKYALKPLIAGGVRIEPREIDLGTDKYELDIRTVVIQRSRVPKARPRLEKWSIKFDIVYNQDLIANPEIIKQCLEEAGQRVGILDFRPQHNGSFGMFTLKEWKVQK